MRKNTLPDMRIVDLGEAIRPSAAVVTIDVVRAFSCTALVLERGAKDVICVESLDQARALHAAQPDTILMGEERGLRPLGFDLGNSPAEIQQQELAARSIIQRTSNGTRGLIKAARAPRLFAGAAVNATTTAQSLLESGIGMIDFLVTDPSTSEDRACAQFMIDIVSDNNPDPEHLQNIVLGSFAEHRALWHRERSDQEIEDFAQDVAICAQVDRCAFAIVRTVVEASESALPRIVLGTSLSLIAYRDCVSS